jgi:transcriptional regulator with XRE-family HTH domain
MNAKYLKISQPAYSMYEKGIREITAKTLKDICIYLNYSADKILELEQDNRKEVQIKINEIIKIAEEIKKM